MITFHKNKKDSGTICWYESSLLTVPQGMFCRSGGTSKDKYSSLNLSYSVGDEPRAVQENRKRLKQLFAIHHLVSCVQIHGNNILVAEDIKQDTEFTGADGLITNQPGIGLLIQQADCQAILFHDPVTKVIGAAHSGWKGSVLNIAAKTVSAMEEKYGATPADIRAVISPSLGPCCAEFVHAKSELSDGFFAHQIADNFFDFWAISMGQLQKAGLQKDNIEITGKCTVCNEDFFSYRRARRKGQSNTGRNGSVICLPLP